MKPHIVSFFRAFSIGLITVASPSIIGCSPQAGPDKSVAGLALGAGWGAGLGAVVGNQVNNSGDGVAIGAGFGAVAGMLHGIGYDLQEGNQLQQNRQLASLQVQAVANQRHLEKLQANLDNSMGSDPVGGVYQVYFDEDQTNMRMGAVASLETIAESIKATSFVRSVVVAGHTDDTGNTRYNEELAKARANSVSAYLASRGIPSVQIDVRSFGATKPIATNATAAGRQLNRRVELSIVR
jgi:outer membrane protein OmpA-like peptidoglycan-associated protein